MRTFDGLLPFIYCIEMHVQYILILTEMQISLCYREGEDQPMHALLYIITIYNTSDIL